MPPNGGEEGKMFDKRQLKVTVGEAFIAEAQTRFTREGYRAGLLSSNCPIALAVRAMFPTNDVSVGTDNVVIFGVGTFTLPEEAQALALRFDQRRYDEVRPLSFVAERV